MSAQDPSLANWPAVASYVSTRKDTYPFIDPAHADLAGKSVLITGASKGIGKAAAIRFALAGCSTILLLARSDLSEVEAAVHAAAVKAQRAQPFVRSLKVDVTSEDSVRAAASTAAEWLGGGGLDVLINNAGYLEEWKPLTDSEPSEWWRTWEVNIKGTYLAAHFFVPLLLRSPTKTVINISSGGAHVMFPGASAYQTTKFALCRLTEFMDTEYRRQGLIAIALHPGAVKTELAMHMPPERQSVLTDTPELAADTLVWLARERREWLAGRFASVSWDMEELEQKQQDVLQRDLFKFRVVV
ncbi:SDR family oxidoreductase [Aspergillus aculeatinus CBS 121060]|uniref:NAD(P)-binding protein n=1 Tax=Aspergillus aculeatinus CBS 121060 TaxID=1448322 RepID=A0ACD1HBQ8_9EURO|nr:NAD(P)-binding protein [Aspergillus aculeatinus CBS 121060]RAH71071.1 NAD(P)-binding protein [Aspergillus aculeatinus CBS 121060]